MINKAILMGRLTADPELNQTQSGVSVCKFRVAVNRQYADKQTGERQADFISVTAWRNTADFVSKYFHKGSMIIVEGSLRNNNYTDQNGVKHYSMEVLADNVNFGESKSASAGTADGGQCNSAPSVQPASTYHQPQTGNYFYQKPSSAPARPQPPSIPNESLQIGDLSDFEVLSDSDVPF